MVDKHFNDATNWIGVVKKEKGTMNSGEMIEENGRKMLELNNIYNMDCLEGMKLMQQQGIKVDWVITDPPYGIGADKDLRANTQYGNAIAKSKEYGKYWYKL